MELNAKPTETNIVLVHDKILMALLAAKNIMALHTFSTGWPTWPPEQQRELYMAYEYTEQVKQLIKDFYARTVTVELDPYMSSLDELGNTVGPIMYIPKELEGAKNE